MTFEDKYSIIINHFDPVTAARILMSNWRPDQLTFLAKQILKNSQLNDLKQMIHIGEES